MTISTPVIGRWGAGLTKGSIGSVTLVGGSATVNLGGSVNNNILLCYADYNGTGFAGNLRATYIDSVSFSIQSSNVSDTHTVNWFAFNTVLSDQGSSLTASCAHTLTSGSLTGSDTIGLIQFGRASLSGGTVTITGSYFTSSLCFATAIGGSGIGGAIGTNKVDDTHFTINSSNPAASHDVYWIAVKTA